MARKLTPVLMLLLFMTQSCTRTKNESTPAPAEQMRKSTGIEKEDSRPVIVALGDSLTAGHGVDEAQNYPSKLQKRLDAAGYKYRVVNAGISGDTSAQGLDRVGPVLAFHPAIVIVELGANDGLRGLPLEATRRNLAAVVSRSQAAGAKVILAGMEMPPNYGPQYTSAFRSVFKNLASEYHAALIPFFLEGVGGHPELNQDDGIHPTAQGYDVVVENVWKVLKPLLDHS